VLRRRNNIDVVCRQTESLIVQKKTFLDHTCSSPSMALASSLHTMSTAPNSSSTNPFLLSKTDLIISDSQLIDILLHDQNTEQKIQTVNRWCKNSRRNRLSIILDVSQRHDVLLSLVNILQQTTNQEYQYNCLTLLSELQANIHHYDQRIYLPG
jgi:hypothetical protein